MQRTTNRFWTVELVTLLVTLSPCHLVTLSAQPVAAPAPKATPADKTLPLPKERHALILCGHPGDAEHVKSFTETVRNLSDGLTKTIGIPPERQHVLFGADRPKDLPSATGPATREAVVAAVAKVRKDLRPEDGLWVICLGHCHHDGRQAWWNLPGPDISATEFGKLFADVSCREQVFVMTTSLSGYFVAPLSRRDRVVIAATEADAETNETTFPSVFAQVLQRGLTLADHDVDKDGKLSLFDLYVVVAKEIAQNYASAEQLATEHQQLDDDGDGIGHELQTAYLPEAQGGAPPGKKPNRPPRDGLLAARIALPLGPDDVADVPSEDLRVGKDENKRYFLIGPGRETKQPTDGYGLVVILPGGPGSADFHPFVKRIYKFAIPDGYLAAQPVAIKWTDKQVIVWPTEKNPAEKMQFSTEDFVAAVIKEIAAKHKVDPKKIFTLSWSSSGPAAYAISLTDKNITGSFIAMSVFNPRLLPPLEKAKGNAYYLYHSPDDKVCPYRMAEQAAKELETYHAKVTLTTYEGGHGWRGGIYENIRQGIEWLEKNSAKPATKE